MQNQQFISEEERAAYAKIEAPMLRLIARIGDFQHSFDGWDPVWTVLFQDRRKRWNSLHVSYYNGNYFITCHVLDMWRQYWQWKVRIGEFCKPDENAICLHNDWPEVSTIEDALAWLDEVERDWIGMYRRLECDWPKRFREGRVARMFVERYVPQFPKQRELAGDEAVKYFCELVESHYYANEDDERFFIDEMTAGDYLELCRIGLSALDDKKDERHPLSGAEYYSRNSYNGSSGTILKVPRDSPEEFWKWIKEKEPYGWHDGGHQFWIGPGRIHLYASLEEDRRAKKERYKLSFTACFASTAFNLVKMAVAFHKAGKHVYLYEARALRDVMLACDELEIVPEGSDTRYSGGGKHFEKIELYELGSRFVNVRDFVKWNPLPILRPRALGYRRLDIMDNDRGSAPNPEMPHGDAASSSPSSMMQSGDAAGLSPSSMMPHGDAASSSPNPEMPSGGAGAVAPGRCSGKARP